MTLGERMRELREAQGLSTRQVALLAEVGSGHVSNLERSARPHPSVWVVARIARALGTTLDELVEDVDWPPPKDYHEGRKRGTDAAV